MTSLPSSGYKCGLRTSAMLVAVSPFVAAVLLGERVPGRTAPAEGSLNKSMVLPTYSLGRSQLKKRQYGAAILSRKASMSTSCQS